VAKQQSGRVPMPVGPQRRAGRRIEKPKDARAAVIRMAAYLKPFTRSLMFVFLFVLVSTGLGVVGPYLIGRAIDRGIGLKDTVGLVNTVLLLAGAYVFGWLTQVAQNYVMAGVAQRALRDLRRDLFEHLQTLSLAFFDRNPRGVLMSHLTNDIDAINRAVSENLTQAIASLLTFVGVLIAMFALNAWLALGTLVVLPFMTWLVGFVGKRVRRGFRNLQRELGSLNANMEETFSGQRTVIAFRQQEAALAAFDESNRSVRDIAVKAQVYPMLIPPMMSILSNANIAIVAGLGGWLTLQGLATIGAIAAFVSYSRQFAGPLRQLGDLYNQIQAALAGAERVFKTLDEAPDVRDVPDALKLRDIAGHVTFDHVGFSYLKKVPVIKNMTFEARPGQTIALVGPTGAGKTTIVNLLTRFYDIQHGRISVDDHDIRQVKKDSLRRQLGIVLQDTILFTSSVMENIRYGRLEAKDEEVVAAAKLANADGFIRRLPDGYQTKLAEQGSNLSLGQRQLLAIARAVLANPRILILDEATSSVDTRTEMHIQDALLKLLQGRTSFVIAHRLSTIRSADMVLVIDGGRIVERGTHDELLDAKGVYYRLYMSQFKGQQIGEPTA